jgi:hypothetical protein
MSTVQRIRQKKLAIGRMRKKRLSNNTTHRSTSLLVVQSAFQDEKKGAHVSSYLVVHPARNVFQSRVGADEVARGSELRLHVVHLATYGVRGVSSR